MKTIQLTNGGECFVDDRDFEYLDKFRWRKMKIGKYWYVSRRIKKGSISMHRLILKASKTNQYVDHINHNGLDNQRENIRLCNNSQNQMNATSKGGSSKFKGVCFDKAKNKWRAVIHLDYKTFNLGYFTTEEEAAYIYDQFATQLFGQFSLTNF